MCAAWEAALPEVPVRLRLARPALMLAIAVLAALGLAGPAHDAAAHSTVDQLLAGDPACTATGLPSAATSDQPLLQEVVPQATGLGAVDVCVNIAVHGTTVALNVREGTLANPGPVLGSVSRIAFGSGFQYLHFDFATVIPVPPGSHLLLEVPDSTVFEWRGTDAAGPDRYPLGASNAGTFDLAFRTYAARPSDAAQGPADQSLLGDPPCDPSAFPDHSGPGTPPAQEFVPGATGVAAVELCVQTLEDYLPVTIAIREGTATSPDAVLQQATGRTGIAGFQWVRVTLDPVLAVRPGERLVIQLDATTPVQWRAVCGTVNEACPLLAGDAYPPGKSNRGDEADFGFRTIAGEPPGAPQGPADQKLANDPACRERNFGAFASSTRELRQSFMPTARGLDAVDLCLNILTASTVVTLNVRSGTIDQPGPVLATVTATAKSAGLQFLRFDLANALPTTPGASYVLEIPASGTFQWRGTCATPTDVCAVPNDDTYPRGAASGTGIRDFAFRTIAGEPFTRYLPLLAQAP